MKTHKVTALSEFVIGVDDRHRRVVYPDRDGVNWVLTVKTCRHGHVWSADNIYVAPNGARMCRACRRVTGRRVYEKWAKKQPCGCRGTEAVRWGHSHEAPKPKRSKRCPTCGSETHSATVGA